MCNRIHFAYQINVWFSDKYNFYRIREEDWFIGLYIYINVIIALMYLHIHYINFIYNMIASGYSWLFSFYIGLYII